MKRSDVSCLCRCWFSEHLEKQKEGEERELLIWSSSQTKSREGRKQPGASPWQPGPHLFCANDLSYSYTVLIKLHTHTHTHTVTQRFHIPVCVSRFSFYKCWDWSLKDPSIH